MPAERERDWLRLSVKDHYLVQKKKEKAKEKEKLHSLLNEVCYIYIKYMLVPPPLLKEC